VAGSSYGAVMANSGSKRERKYLLTVISYEIGLPYET